MKARIENEQVKIYGTLPKDFKHYLNFAEADEALLKSEGFFDLVTPEYDPEKQRLGEVYFDAENNIVTYRVINKTQEEIAEEQVKLLENLANQNDSKIDWALIKKLLVQEKLDALTNEKDAIEYRTLYQTYRLGITLATGERFYYPLNDKLYEVIQGHTTTLEWKPDLEEALYKEVLPPGQIGEWVQPTGSHDAYNTGDKVLFNGQVYESKIDGNVWSPTEYPQGWSLIN